MTVAGLAMSSSSLSAAGGRRSSFKRASKMQQQDLQLHPTVEPLYATVRRRRRPDKHLIVSDEVFHAAAIVIQRWYRSALIKRQFSRLMSMAFSQDRMDKRLSLIGNYGPEDIDAELETEEKENKSAPPPPIQEIDRLILQAAGLMASAQTHQQARQDHPSTTTRQLKARNKSSNFVYGEGNKRCLVRRSISMRTTTPNNNNNTHSRTASNLVSKQQTALRKSVPELVVVPQQPQPQILGCHHQDRRKRNRYVPHRPPIQKHFLFTICIDIVMY